MPTRKSNNFNDSKRSNVRSRKSDDKPVSKTRPTTPKEPAKKVTSKEGPKFAKKEEAPKKNTGALPYKRAPLKKAKPPRPVGQAPAPIDRPEAEKDTVRLNKFLAHAGIAARRKADMMIEQGLVSVNGLVVREMGYRVKPDDIIRYKDKVIKQKTNFVYILLNKPSGYITTTTDDRERRTVMEFVADATKERVYPVGRLDRQTTGLLLLTNDGDLAQQLSHPSHKVEKVYQVQLDRPLTPKDEEAIRNGLKLEDGVAIVDDLAFIKASNRAELGIVIHIGRNRIVRRIFEHLGYTVEKLDRTVYAGMTKRLLPRGKYRLLNENEISFLKRRSYK
ncbi:MAG: hypothetical protein RL138_813 [Bacteroidota bacterium]|jgi:23S rRNA pseudouridine2605 synthase|nr:pseudouridine synthase [Chitinophagales bacterium]